MSETLQHVETMVEDRPDVDNTPAYLELWALMGELKARLDDRLPVTPDPSSEQLQSYGPSGGDPASRLPGGSMRTFSGPQVDWQVHSWVGNPSMSFSNMHLTTWLGPEVKVPHLGFAFGTLPDLFFLIEYTPRSDLIVDLDSLDRYYGEVNDAWLEAKETPGLRYFTSRSLFIRESLSPTSLVFTADITPEMLALVRRLAHEALDRWFGWLDAAEPTPVEERAALAQRDLQVRRAIAERDPANVFAVKYFGQEFADALVRQLWGGDRAQAGAG